MKDFLGFLFRFVLLPKQIAFLFGTQISPSQLIPANPRNGFFAILKSERHGRKADFGMFLKNRITVVTINKGVTPNDQRREQLAFFEDNLNILFQYNMPLRGLAQMTGGISMVIFFFGNKIIFPEGEAQKAN